MKFTVKLLVMGMSLFFTLTTIKAQEKMIFPRAFAFAVDDLGWNIGNDDGDVDGVGPYRIGIDRKMGVKDYQGIVKVGKEVGVRVQCLFVMAEMDRLNILGKHPTTTWEGANWDNTKNICNEQIEIMDFVKENAANMEFGLHGVGHEFWVDGVKKRAEWYCQQDDHPWPEKTIREHIQCFKDIMAQYGLSEAEGQSFPESFVPCAYGYYWNPGAGYSTGKVMADNGLKYVNTLFDYIRELNPPKEANGGGFDNGVHVINRINYGNEWFKLAALPTKPLSEQETDIIETHWTNWLAQDDFLQDDLDQKFIDYYRMVQKSANRYVAKNTEQLHSQWLYKKYTTVTEAKRGTVIIDNTKMPADAYFHDILGNMVLKIKLNDDQHISKALLNGKPVGAYFQDGGYGFLYLPPLKQQVYTLEYKVGKKHLPAFICHKGTGNIYDFATGKGMTKAKVRVYGTQKIIFKGIGEPRTVEIDNKNIRIVKRTYKKEKNAFILTVKGRDIQGETGTIILR